VAQVRLVVITSSVFELSQAPKTFGCAKVAQMVAKSVLPAVKATEHTFLRITTQKFFTDYHTKIFKARWHRLREDRHGKSLKFNRAGKNSSECNCTALTHKHCLAKAFLTTLPSLANKG